MLDIKFIRENAELIKKNCVNRLANVDIDRLLQLDKERREIEKKLDDRRAERNQASKTKPTPEIIARMKKTGEDIKYLETDLAKIEPEFKELWLAIPNLTHPDVKIGSEEDESPVLETCGRPTKFKFKPKDHVELAADLDIIDFDRATKVSGAKFYYLKKDLALMEIALIQYALDIAVKRGFTPFLTPDLAKHEVLEGLGFNPRGESTQVYNIADSDLCLIGTAEITLGGLHQDEILNAIELPKKYVAVSHCFRTEAGSYSKFSKGIFRVHQFTKIEMFAYALPHQAEKLHKDMLEIQKEIFKGLGLPFRVIDHTTGDLGNPSYRTLDLEAWMPGKPNKTGADGDWGEVTSVSNCTDYQARGLNIKYKTAGGEKEFVYTLNGTAIAIPRCLIAILENNQQADGSVVIPKVLRKYMVGAGKVIKKK